MKKVPGYESYAIDTEGNVYSLNYRRSGKTKKLKMHLCPHLGYMKVRLCKDGKPKTFFVHRLMLRTYWDEQFQKYETDHINGVRHDNRISNLRPCTRKENALNRTKSVGCTKRKHGKWQAQIMTKDGYLHLGMFDTKKEAMEAYKVAKKIYHTIEYRAPDSLVAA